MLQRCANRFCSAPRHYGQGTIFRVDLDLANAAGEKELKKTFLWLCPRCSQVMSPTVEVTGNTVKVRLTRHVCQPATTIN
jgi:hypothetical protein